MRWVRFALRAGKIGLAAILVSSCAGPASVGERTVLNVLTAGDVNMVELHREILGPEFMKRNPSVAVNATGSGPGDPGSRAILNRLMQQKAAGAVAWDVDVAVVHQAAMEELITNDLLARYAPEVGSWKLLAATQGRNAFGFNVEGYVMPMFQSQVALAYNPDLVKSPPNTFEELVAWIKANPRKFGYNGVKGGMSGTAFVAAWIYWKTGQYEKYTVGPYDKAAEAGWPAALQELKSLPITLTTGNNDTLDKLNRGEIAMGPVWVDILINRKNEHRMDPKIRMKLIAPGLPGQPMYLVVTKKAANYELAKRYVEFITSPEQQAKVIVERQGWLPGIDAAHVLPLVSRRAKTELFQDVPAEVLRKYSLDFPTRPYFMDLIRLY